MSLQRFLEVFCFCVLALLLAGCGCRQEAAADLVIRNGVIYTMDENQPTAEAVAVAGGKIVFVGSSQEVQSRTGPQTQVIDLQGKTMTPGFIESHGHLLSLGYAQSRLDLNEVENYDELVQRVAEAVQQTQPGEWILGRGWHQSKWTPPPRPMVRGFQTHHALSKVSPNNPVYLKHASGHAGFANAKAMEIAGVTRATTFNKDGEIVKDAQGNPTGIFNELAQRLITDHIPESTPERNRQALELAIQNCLENGITSFQDAGAGKEAIETYREFLQQGRLKVRLWAMLAGRDEQLLNEWYEKGPEIGSGENFLTVRAIKLVCDGALGTRGAWLLEPYSDRPGHYGFKTLPMEYVHKVAEEALKNGFQLCTHAIGDRANREVLDQFEKALQANPEAARDHRFRIEHAQHLSARDIPRFAQLGVIASMQGIHMASDRPWAIHRLGEARIVEGAYVWQKLLKSGAKVINGTDVPVEPINPIANFYASVTRQTLQGAPAGGYEPDQRMTRAQALRSYTLDAAYGAFEQDIKGSITVGKLADFTVFSQDIMQVPESELLKTRVEMTIVAGEILYRRETEAVSLK